MILLILFGVLFILGFVLIAVSVFNYWFDEGVVGGAMGVAFGTAFFVCLAVVCIVNGSPSCNEKITWYEQQVISLNNTYSVLTNTDIHNEVAVQQYNQDVAKFKGEILSAQANLNNLWVNWFTCPAYNNMDANAVKYIVYEVNP